MGNKWRELKINKRDPDSDWVCDCGGELQFNNTQYEMGSEVWECKDCETTWSVGVTVTRDWQLAYAKDWQIAMAMLKELQ